MRLTLSVWFFLVICTIKSVLALSSTFSWEELIQQAAEEALRGRYQQALEKLQIADETGEPRDFRYYWILGKTLHGKGDELEALKSFETSLRMNPDQPKILQEMTDLYDSLRFPNKALDTARVLLAKDPENRELRYRALLWSSRIGNLEYYRAALQELETNNPYLADEQALLDEITGFQKAGKLDDSIARCKRFLPFFPRNKNLHRLCLLSYKSKDASLYEEGLIQRAVIFRDEPIYHHILSMEYLDQRRFVESAALARRALLLALRKAPFPDKDYLLPLRRYYIQIGSDSGIQATELLEEVIRNKKNLSTEEWSVLLNHSSYNWEVLAFALKALPELEPDEKVRIISREWRESYKNLKLQELEKDLSRFAGPYHLDKSFQFYLENALAE
ncbi:hypothetical protein EHO59_17760 [Leptospira semungkisensis]|uniref:Uncharacterized protein n=1 Tax=Leptospira semungkisensis TaxID=2484985 RepID=A0A4R9FMF8_9LEPT|nr:hypothetical protein [Leptospira semungkisensis]TGJ99787.1 hypothetical protein EHO59_17760 [Leptospira semungkisensis]